MSVQGLGFKVQGWRMKVGGFALACLLACAAGAEEANPVRTLVSVTSEPSGATVLVDGRDRGVTPLSLYDVAPGRHLMKCRLAGYEEQVRFFSVEPGVPLQRNATLEPVKGILLLKSDPAGCQIVMDGVTLGETPRLMTTLNAKDTHKIELRKTGYLPSTIDVRFEGRTPLVRNERLVLDSAVIAVESDPPGAKVTVNGIERGVTPVVVEGVPKGIASVKVSLDGFQEEVRELRVKAGDRPTLVLALQGLPGTLHVASVPEGARLYVDGAYAGKAPLVLPKLAPGKYSLRAELEGYGTETREVEILNGATPNVEFRLTNRMGRIEIRSNPPGATVLLDGKPVGVTKARDPNAERSDVFSIPDVMSGEHHLKLVRDGYTEFARTVKVTELKTFPVKAVLKRVFKPDVEITTATRVFRGVLVKNSPELVTVEVSPGMMRGIERSTIRKIEFIEDGKSGDSATGNAAPGK